MNLSLSQRLEAREFSIPAGARRVTCKTSGAMVALFPFGGKAAVKTFAAGAAKPAHYYTFRTPEQRDAWAADWLKSRAAVASIVAERKAKRKAFVHSLAVGAILYSSWGYDQTNVNFYQVVAVSGKAVVIREIAAQSSGSSEVVAIKDSFKGEPLRKLVGEGNVLKIASYSYAHPWDGRPKHVSRY